MDHMECDQYVLTAEGEGSDIKKSQSHLWSGLLLPKQICSDEVSSTARC